MTCPTCHNPDTHRTTADIREGDQHWPAADCRECECGEIWPDVFAPVKPEQKLLEDLFNA